MKKLNIDQFIASSVEWIKDYAEKAGVKGFVLGVSGGVDSALVSTLCAKTGMPVLCMNMPIHQHPDHVSRSNNHIAWLKEQFGKSISSHVIDLTDTFETAKVALEAGSNQLDADATGRNKELAEANTRSRLRMVTLRYLANVHKYLVAGTGNRVEDFGIGFFTVGGDGSVDFSPIGDLTKTEVWEVARQLGVNQEIIDAKPSDGLWGNHRSDEDQIGASYPELEWAMEYFETNVRPLGEGAANSSINTIATQVGKQTGDERKKEVMRIYLTRHRANRFKMEPVPLFDSSACRESVYSTAN